MSRERGINWSVFIVETQPFPPVPGQKSACEMTMTKEVEKKKGGNERNESAKQMRR
jgi:hypothetical protein